MKAFLLFALIFFVALSSAIDERSLLMDFYKSTNGDRWFHNWGWGSSYHFCEWWGIKCDKRNVHVIEINLSDNKLNGSLPSSFSQLSYLRVLNLSNNTIALPSRIENPVLLSFDASHNPLVGTIPYFVTNFLTHLKLSHCKINKFPTFVGNLSNLKTLSLSHNFLTGPLATFLTMTKLETLDLQSNMLSGTIPPFSWNIHYVDVSNNGFTGTIPSELGYPIFLSLAGNKLTGSLPSNFAYLSLLSHLDLSNNLLSGEIPEINLYSMEYLDMSYNRFSQVSFPGQQVNTERLQNLYCNLEGIPNLKCAVPSFSTYFCYANCA